ncbi:hypothetical protein [Novosphingobium terrae]|uniref:hypothetical protein n=1 Tax=Novosphingobium terrae TaxID=2726189 RepID=UPI0019809C62|nr:hypothetical protein [Novosphingobium terrae]
MTRPRTFQAARPDPRQQASNEASLRLKGTMALLGVGLAILAFLVAIDRPQWFHIRPATGTSLALSHAMGGKPADSKGQQAVKPASHP